MYINWPHYYLPKLCALLSYIFNINFIILIMTEKKSIMGKYRFMLVFFASFNLVYSTVEQIIPIAIHGTNSTFIIYISDGPFFESEKWSQHAISFRCGFIALSYAILIIHFLYRYFAIFNTQVLQTLSKPLGLFAVFIFFILHGIIWSMTGELCFYATEQIRQSFFGIFRDVYNVDPTKIQIMVAIYRDAAPDVIARSWTGILFLTAFSFYVISLYIIVGTMISRKLHTHAFSETTIRFHRRLLKSLIIQTIIPICISFSPCFFAWYSPIFMLDIGQWNNYLGVLALSAFPVLDPLVVMSALPNYRNRILGYLKMDRFVTENRSSDIRFVTKQNTSNLSGHF